MQEPLTSSHCQDYFGCGPKRKDWDLVQTVVSSGGEQS